MAKPKQIKLTDDGVITQAALAAYVEGRLSDAERAEVDGLLVNDPFAQEALEGLRGSASLGKMPTVIHSINTRLREKTGAKEHKDKGITIHWSVYAYTLVIIAILLGVGFVIVHVLSNKNQQTNTAPPAQESVPVIQDTAKAIADTMALAQAVDSTTIEAASDTMQQVAAPVAPDGGPDVKPEDAIAKARNPATPEIAARLDTAKKYFGAGDYVTAEKLYNKVLAVQPDNLDALYFGGVSGYLNETKGLGEANFDKLIKAGFYTDGTKWYKANILIRHGQKNEAKQLLRDLVNTNSIFKDRAIKKYEELYK